MDRFLDWAIKMFIVWLYWRSVQWGVFHTALQVWIAVGKPRVRQFSFSKEPMSGQDHEVDSARSYNANTAAVASRRVVTRLNGSLVDASTPHERNLVVMRIWTDGDRDLLRSRAEIVFEKVVMRRFGTGVRKVWAYHNELADAWCWWIHFRWYSHGKSLLCHVSWIWVELAVHRGEVAGRVSGDMVNLFGRKMPVGAYESTGQPN